jgi:homoserine kinase type II
MSSQIFILTHARELPDGDEDVKLIGVYSTQELAQSAQARAKQRRGFMEHPDGFLIQAYELDQDDWEEGFGEQDDEDE